MDTSVIKSILFHCLIIGFLLSGYFLNSQDFKKIHKPDTIKVKTINLEHSLAPKQKTAFERATQYAEEQTKAKEIQNELIEKAKQEQLKKIAAEIQAKKIEQDKIIADKERKRQAWLKKIAAKKKAKKLAIEKAKKQQIDAEKERKRQAWLAKVRKRRQAEQLKKQTISRKIKTLQQKLGTKDFNNNLSQKSDKNLSKSDYNNNNETNTILAKYSQKIRQKMYKYWQRPLNSRNLQLKATVGLRLKRGGEITRIRITKSSGFIDFDISIQSALWSAGTLPIPNDPKYAELFTKEELIMEFNNF